MLCVLQIGVATQGACFVLAFPLIHVDHKGPLTFHFDDIKAFPGQIGTWSKFCIQALSGCPLYARLVRTLREGQHEAGIDANTQQKHVAVTLSDASKLVAVLKKNKFS